MKKAQPLAEEQAPSKARRWRKRKTKHRASCLPASPAAGSYHHERRYPTQSRIISRLGGIWRSKVKQRCLINRCVARPHRGSAGATEIKEEGKWQRLTGSERNHAKG